MINYYQPFLLPFLRRKTYRLPRDIRQTYFVSFEDAVWVLLRAKHIPKGSSILIPDFYCMDVVDNIRGHGFVPVWYPLNRNFAIEPSRLKKQIDACSPSAVILFNACGLPVLPSLEIASLVESYPEVLFIEDMVHRLTDPTDVRLYGRNHVAIDSLRKVSPLSGSFLYQQHGDVRVLPDMFFTDWRYVLSSFAWFAVFRFCFILGTITGWPRLIHFAHTALLKRHDDIIGDSIGGYRGHPFIPYIHRHFHFEKVRNQKASLVSLYLTLLNPFLKTHKEWSLPSIPQKIYGDLHVFPLLFSGQNAHRSYQKIEAYLLSHGVVCWFKFPDSLWSRKQLVLFLPLGFHIRPRHIQKIAKVLAALPDVTGHEVLHRKR